jgi:hypothetical protein
VNQENCAEKWYFYPKKIGSDKYVNIMKISSISSLAGISGNLK